MYNNLVKMQMKFRRIPYTKLLENNKLTKKAAGFYAAASF